MRISDWSSDVCSSDLIDPRGEFARGVAVAGEDRDTIAILMLRRQFERGLEIGRADDLQHGAENLFLVAFHVGGDMVEQRRADEESLFVEIGRASCRERVCQYV